jgi:hypothetical protein
VTDDAKDFNHEKETLVENHHDVAKYDETVDKKEEETDPALQDTHGANRDSP